MLEPSETIIETTEPTKDVPNTMQGVATHGNVFGKEFDITIAIMFSIIAIICLIIYLIRKHRGLTKHTSALNAFLIVMTIISSIIAIVNLIAYLQ